MENKSVDSINETAQGCPLSSLSDTFRLSNEQLEPLFRRARTEHPVYFLPDIGYWAVSRYEDIRMVLSDKERFSSEITLQPLTPHYPEVVELLKHVRHDGERRRPDFRQVGLAVGLDRERELFRRRIECRIHAGY